MNGIVAFFLSFLTFLASITSVFVSPEAPADTGEFTPVMRFIISSDSHVATVGDTQTTRIEKMIKLGYDIAEKDEEYKKLDAVLMAGDITDDGTKLGFASFKAAQDAVLKDGTKALSVIAKSHDSNSMGNTAAGEYFTQITGQPTDFHEVINGFHFIGISVTATSGEHYSQYQKDWLKEQLNEAVKDDPFKPIFVVHHEHVSNTVYGSSDFEGWGMSDFKDILEKYPQVVDFSGHSHYPINDARSIWQGGFTALGTGGLYYVELTIDDERTVHPQGYKKVASFWVVEVDANNRIRLRAVDLGAEEYLCEYNLNTPFDRSYIRAAQLLRSRKPEFKEGTTLDVKGKKVTFAAAESKDGMPIFMYRAYAVDGEGNRTPVGKTLPEYYNYDVPDTVTIKLENLPDGDYTLEVVAENCFGMQSDPIK